VLRIPLRHHSAWEEQEWKRRKREREDNASCEEDEIRKEARGSASFSFHGAQVFKSKNY